MKIMKIDEMNGQQRINDKPVIDFNEAIKMLYDKLDKFDAGNDVYELVTDIFHRFRDEIEDKYTVVDYDGCPIDTSSNESELWYDDEFNDFYDNCITKIKKYV